MSRARLLQFSLLFVGLALAPLALLLLSDFAGMDTLGLVMVLGAVCALPTVLDRLGGRFELFEAINVVCYFSFVQFGLATLYLLYNPPAAYDSRVLPYLNVSLLYCIIGFGSMVYGYFLVRRLGDVHHAPERVIRGSVWIAVLFGVGAAGQFAERLSEQQMYESSRVGGLVSAFCQLEQLALFGYFLLLFLWFSGMATATHKLLLCGAVIPYELLQVYFRLGSKSFCLTILGLPIVAYWYAKKRLPPGVVIVFALLAVFLVFPFYNTYRRTSHQYSTTTRISMTVDTLSGHTPEAYAEESLYMVGRRMALINSVAVIVRETGRSVDFQHGKTIALAAISLAIPRFLWPEKPIINLGREFAREFHILPRFDQWTWVAITAIGELYWNFGLPGIIVGMFVIGVILQLVYRHLGQEGSRDPIHLAMYVSLIPSFLNLDGNIASWLAGLVRAVIIYSALDLALQGFRGIRHAPSTLPPSEPAPGEAF